MKYKSVLLLSIFGVIAGCSHLSDNNRLPSSTQSSCGLFGKVGERIDDCLNESGAKRRDFVLVTRSEDGRKIYKELTTGLIWSYRLLDTMDQYEAEKICNVFGEQSGITNVSWRLPTIKEYETAEKNGIRKLPDMKHWFWSSSA